MGNLPPLCAPSHALRGLLHLLQVLFGILGSRSCGSQRRFVFLPGCCFKHLLLLPAAHVEHMSSCCIGVFGGNGRPGVLPGFSLRNTKRGCLFFSFYLAVMCLDCCAAACQQSHCFPLLSTSYETDTSTCLVEQPSSYVPWTLSTNSCDSKHSCGPY